MASAAEERTGAAGAEFVPALIAGAPQPPSLVERLGAQPEDADERFAFALWSAGRKDEAVEFLERQIALRKAGGHAPGPAVIDVAPSDIRVTPAERPAAAPGIDPSDRPPLPPPPIPLRPFFVGAAALALALFLFWPVLKGIATFEGLAESTETALEAESGPATLGGGNAEESPQVAVETQSIPPAVEEEAADAEVAAVRDVTPASIQGPPLPAASGENVVEIPPPAIDKPAAASVPEVQVAESPAVTLPPEEEVALVSSPDVSAREQPTDAPTAGLDEALVSGASVAGPTLATLADEVWDGARLPRPRPQPSAEVVAALNAPPVPPRPVYTYGATQQPPVVVPPSYSVPPAPNYNEPRRLTIIGRVGSRGNVASNAPIRRYGAPWAPVRPYPSVNVYRYQPPAWPGASPGGY